MLYEQLTVPRLRETEFLNMESRVQMITHLAGGGQNLWRASHPTPPTPSPKLQGGGENGEDTLLWVNFGKQL